MTPQGIAIQDVSSRFGNGQTLPFTPCKRGYIPFRRRDENKNKNNKNTCSDGNENHIDHNNNDSISEKRMLYGCHLHHDLRKARVEKNGGYFKNGEKNLRDFWK